MLAKEAIGSTKDKKVYSTANQNPFFSKNQLNYKILLLFSPLLTDCLIEWPDKNNIRNYWWPQQKTCFVALQQITIFGTGAPTKLENTINQPKTINQQSNQSNKQQQEALMIKKYQLTNNSTTAMKIAYSSSRGVLSRWRKSWHLHVTKNLTVNRWTLINLLCLCVRFSVSRWRTSVPVWHLACPLNDSFDHLIVYPSRNSM